MSAKADCLSIFLSTFIVSKIYGPFEIGSILANLNCLLISLRRAHLSMLNLKDGIWSQERGHELTNMFLRKIFNTEKVFNVIEPVDFKTSKKFDQKELEKIAVNA